MSDDEPLEPKMSARTWAQPVPVGIEQANYDGHEHQSSSDSPALDDVEESRLALDLAYVKGQNALTSLAARLQRSEVERDAIHKMHVAATARIESLETALRKAQEWAAGYPLGGDMDARAAADVYESARRALAPEPETPSDSERETT